MTVELRPSAEWFDHPSTRPLDPGARSRANALADLVRSRSSALGARPYAVEARGPRGLSFLELDRAVASWVAHFDARGLAPEARVGIVVADPLDFAVVYLALMASGRWAAPLDPGAPVDGPGGVRGALARLTLSAVVADRPRPPDVEAAWLDLAEDPAPPARTGLADAPTPATGGALLASSGTTGTPKVIPLPVDQLLCAARAIARHHQLTAEDRGFCPLPLFHVNAEVVGLLSTLVAGSSVVLDGRFHRTGFWELLGYLGVTWVNAVPAIISHLSTLGPGEQVPAEVRFVRSASAPLPAATLARFEAATGIPVLETYGMTEAASQITANPLNGVRKPGTVGLPVGVELRIVPEDGATEDGATDGGVPRRRMTGGDATEGGHQVVGHVEIRGASVITAYGGGHHADRFADGGWLRTGDLGHLDADGYLTLVGRSDDVVNRGGEKIFPREIEEIILTDPDVAEAAVVGEDDPVFGQVPVAFVTLVGAADGHRPAQVLARVHELLEAAVVRPKRPVALHVVADLPKGATGKVQRRAVSAVRLRVLHSLASR